MVYFGRCHCGRESLHRYANDFAHYGNCPEGCFTSGHGLGPWEVVRVHDPQLPARKCHHHVVILPEYLAAQMAISVPAEIPCLWISRKPKGRRRYGLRIGPPHDSTEPSYQIPVNQIKWRQGNDLALHPRWWRSRSWLVISEPKHHLRRCFHRLTWSTNVRAALDQASIDRVIEELRVHCIRLRCPLERPLCRFSPFVSLNINSLARGLRLTPMLSKRQVLEWEPTLESALGRGETGLCPFRFWPALAGVANVGATNVRPVEASLVTAGDSTSEQNRQPEMAVAAPETLVMDPNQSSAAGDAGADHPQLTVPSYRDVLIRAPPSVPEIKEAMDSLAVVAEQRATNKSQRRGRRARGSQRR